MPKYTVERDPRRGRFCKVTQDIQPGQVVLTEEPLECVLYDDEASSWCHNSFRKRNEQLSR